METLLLNNFLYQKKNTKASEKASFIDKTDMGKACINMYLSRSYHENQSTEVLRQTKHRDIALRKVASKANFKHAVFEARKSVGKKR